MPCTFRWRPQSKNTGGLFDAIVIERAGPFNANLQFPLSGTCLDNTSSHIRGKHTGSHTDRLRFCSIGRLQRSWGHPYDACDTKSTHTKGCNHPFSFVTSRVHDHYSFFPPQPLRSDGTVRAAINSVDKKNPHPLPDTQKLRHCLDMNTQTKPPGRVDALARTILTPLLCVAAGCEAPSATSYQHVSRGMSEAQVQEILGRPSSRLKQSPSATDQAWAERWHWGDTLSTRATNAIMPDQPPPPQIGTVWFDASGQVVRAEAPQPTTSEPLDTPWLPPAIPAR